MRETMLTHWTSRRFSLRDMCYLQKIDMKPKGLWFDVDDDWVRWISEEDMLSDKWVPRRLLPDMKELKAGDPFANYEKRRWKGGRKRNHWRERVKHSYRVTITDWSRVLVLSTPEQLDEFTARFVAVPPDLEDSRRQGLFQNSFLDWKRVAEEYSALIIAPYVWERRMQLMWYYGWDCASGVCWEPSILKLEHRFIPDA